MNVVSPFVVVPTYAMTESFPICSNPPHLEIRLATVGPAMGPRARVLRGDDPADARALPVRVEVDTLVGAEHAPALDADQRPRPLRRQGGAEEVWCTRTITAHERYHWIIL